MRPLILVNFKAYPETAGARASALAELCERVARTASADIAVAPPLPSLALVASSVKIPVFSQHCDASGAGAFTGHVTASGLAAFRVHGSLLNHAERPLPLRTLARAVQQCRKHKLTTVVCAPSLRSISAILSVCTPSYIAYEPPALIGGSVSVTTAKPGIVTAAVQLLKKKRKSVRLLCGAGVKTRQDVQAALRLGAAGVLVASAVVKAKDPERALRALVAPHPPR